MSILGVRMVNTIGQDRSMKKRQEENKRAGVAVNPILCLGASCHRQATSWRFRSIGKPPA